MKHFVSLIFIIHFLDICGQEARIVNKLKEHNSQISFIENKNQWDSQIKYFLKISDQNYWIKDDGFRADMYSISKLNNFIRNDDKFIEDSFEKFGHVWDFTLVNKNTKSSFISENKKAFYHNYILGNDSTKWASKVSMYESIIDREIYRNIDIRYYGNEKRDLEYDFIVHPGGDFKDIQFVLKGLDKISVNEEGEIEMTTTYFGKIPLSKPHTYQIINGRKLEIESRYILNHDTVSFQIATYDPNYDLIIDPVVKYSTYLDCLGCTSCTNYSFDIDVNDSLEALVTGKTYYNTYPVTTGAYKAVTTSNQYDVFITKLTVNGDNLLYSTFFGGIGGDYGYSICYDTAHNIVFTGNTQSINFPLVNNLFPPFAVSSSILYPFVAKLDSSGGTLIFSSVINPPATAVAGGRGSGVITDKNNNVFVTGFTSSSNFPITSGAIRSTYTLQEGFLMKFSPIGNLIFSTFIGGSNVDVLRGIDIDKDDNVYIVGQSNSTDFHLSSPGYSKVKAGIPSTYDVIVCKVKGDGSAIIYATYVGGSTSSETGTAIAVDINGNVFFTGHGASANYPTTAGSFKASPTAADIFVTSLDTSGMILRNSTAIGNGSAFGIDVDDCGFVVISGYTSSPTFPVTPNAFKKVAVGLDNIVVVLDSVLSSLTFSTLFGGTSADYGEASVSINNKTLIVSGTTHSNNFPTTAGAYQTSRFGTNSCDAPVVYAFNQLCFITQPIVTANPLFFCDTTSQMVTLKGQKTIGGCNSDTSNVLIKWSKGYQRTLIGYGDSISVFLKLNDTIYAQAVDTFNLCTSKEFLFITQYVFSVYDVTICAGSSYMFNGINRTTSGFYKDTFRTGNNCDSVVILNLIVSAPTSSVFQNICFQDSALWNGVYLKTNGSYKDTFKSVYNCDSIVTLTLTMITPTKTIPIAICSGDSFLWNGIYQKTTGNYRDTLSGLGCDTIVTLNLTIKPVKFYSFSNTICIGDSILWNGVYQKTIGAYKDTFISSIGCDSIVTLYVFYKANLQFTSNEIFCEGDTFKWNGVEYYAAGSYKDTFTSSLGCDSIHTIELTMIKTSFDTIRIDLCEGDSILWNGNYRKTTGYYLKNLYSIKGCDSMVVLRLVIQPIKRDIIDSIICNNIVFHWNGSVLTSNGVYSDTLMTSFGCDSFVTLHLTIRPPVPDTYIFDTTCAGNPKLWNGVNINASGVYPDTFINADGCDSIVLLNLHVYPYVYVYSFDTICQGLYRKWNGIERYNTGVYYDTLFTISGCDTIHVLNLNVIPTQYGTISNSICTGDSFLFNTIYEKTTGTYLDTLTSSLGCDSILSLNLTVKQNLKDTIYDTICLGQTHLWNGKLNSTPGIYSDTSLGSNGCDSFTFLYLFVKPKPIIVLTRCFNPNTNFLFLGKNLSTPGYYIDSTNSSGCDTVFQLTLNLLTPSHVFKDTIACQFLYLNNQYYSQSDSQIRIFQSQSKCDSIVLHYKIIILNPNPKTDSRFNYFCDSFLYKGKYFFKDSIFYDTVKSTQNPSCDSLYKVIKYQKSIRPSIWITDTIFTIIRGQKIKYTAHGASNYRWSTGDSINQITLSPKNEQVYFVKGWNDYCYDSIGFKVIVYSDVCRVEFPTAFTPNGDGNNDIFIGRPFEGSKITSFKVYDRIGQLLFSTTNGNEGWDGTYKNELQNSEPYYYTYTATSCIPGKTQSGEGNFMLLR